MPQQEPISSADRLREPERTSEPDIRNLDAGGQANEALQIQHAGIAEFTLVSGVPLAVAVQFETAKNLYLYAWHVYRFFPIAEAHALVTLEFGLRERLAASLPKETGKKTRPLTLARLLKIAVSRGLIRNEGFRRWHAAGQRRAAERQHWEHIQMMIDEGLECVEVDDTDTAVAQEDLSWDLVDVLVTTLHKHRNMHAHGGPHLTRDVLGTFELVAEILNQIFDGKDEAS